MRREPPRERAGTASPQDLLIEVEVANFYPSIAVGFSEPVYEMTQSAVHVLVTHAFLRSLAKLDLARSKVGQFADQPGAGRLGRRRRAHPGPHARFALSREPRLSRRS